MDRDRVRGIERNDWKGTNSIWSCTGPLPKLRSQGRWERTDLEKRITVRLDTQKFAVPVRHTYANVHLGFRRYLVQINKCGIC